MTYQGGHSWKISQGDLAVSVNPQSKVSADVTLFSSGKSDTSEKSGFVIMGPGEYEIKDISIKGFLSVGEAGKINTIYVVNFEGMNLCFLGSLANIELPSETLEQMEDIDILFAPVTSHKLAVSLEPSLIIPADYNAESLKKFLKEVGEDEVKPEEKLVIKKKDLEGKEGEIVVLKQE